MSGLSFLKRLFIPDPVISSVNKIMPPKMKEKPLSALSERSIEILSLVISLSKKSDEADRMYDTLIYAQEIVKAIAPFANDENSHASVRIALNEAIAANLIIVEFTSIDPKKIPLDSVGNYNLTLVDVYRLIKDDLNELHRNLSGLLKNTVQLLNVNTGEVVTQTYFDSPEFKSWKVPSINNIINPKVVSDLFSKLILMSQDKVGVAIWLNAFFVVWSDYLKFSMKLPGSLGETFKDEMKNAPSALLDQTISNQVDTPGSNFFNCPVTGNSEDFRLR